MSDNHHEKHADEIKKIVAETIKEVHEAQSIRFSRPNTLRGWLMTLGIIGGFIGFLWSAIIFLDDIAKHHEQPYHIGAEKLVLAIEEKHEEHVKRHEAHVANNELHRREEQLQLQIMRETKPIKESIQTIKQDVRSIETKVDILIDRAQRD
jgi:hypothetical protein